MKAITAGITQNTLLPRNLEPWKAGIALIQCYVRTPLEHERCMVSAGLPFLFVHYLLFWIKTSTSSWSRSSKVHRKQWNPHECANVFTQKHFNMLHRNPFQVRSECPQQIVSSLTTPRAFVLEKGVCTSRVSCRSIAFTNWNHNFQHLCTS